MAACISKGRLTFFVDNRRKVELAREARRDANMALSVDENSDLAHHVMGRWHTEMAQVCGCCEYVPVITVEIVGGKGEWGLLIKCLATSVIHTPFFSYSITVQLQINIKRIIVTTSITSQQTAIERQNSLHNSNYVLFKVPS